MIVLPCGNPVHIFVGIEHGTAVLRLPQVSDHLILVDTRLQSQVYRGILLRINQIVTLILRIVHAELLTDELCGGVHLHAQVTSAHGIEQVETNGEVLSKACLHGLTQQLSRFEQHQVDRRDLKVSSLHVQEEAVLFWHTIEAPSVVRLIRFQGADLFHPLSAPGCRVEEGHYPEGCFHGLFQPPYEGITADHLWQTGDMGIDPVIDPGQ